MANAKLSQSRLDAIEQDNKILRVPIRFKLTMKTKNFYIVSFLFMAFCSVAVAQRESITNSEVIEMVRGGLGEEIVVAKIRKSQANFDLSAVALVELKKAGVSDSIILLMMEKSDESQQAPAASVQTFSESAGDNSVEKPPKDGVRKTKTIAIVKSSVQPSRQALEKELLKRPEWKDLGLSIDRYRDTADLYVEIGYVSMSWLTHRYVYRIYDRRTGTILAGGETTSWGSLAENLARHIAKSLAKIRS